MVRLPKLNTGLESDVITRWGCRNGFDDDGLGRRSDGGRPGAHARGAAGAAVDPLAHSAALRRPHHAALVAQVQGTVCTPETFPKSSETPTSVIFPIGRARVLWNDL